MTILHVCTIHNCMLFFFFACASNISAIFLFQTTPTAARARYIFFALTDRIEEQKNRTKNDKKMEGGGGGGNTTCMKDTVGIINNRAQ